MCSCPTATSVGPRPAVVAEVRKLAPKQPTALLVDRHVTEAGVSSMDAVEWAREAGVTFLGLHYSLCDAALGAGA